MAQTITNRKSSFDANSNSDFDVEVEDQGASGKRQVIKVAESALPSGAATESTLTSLSSKVTACNTNSISGTVIANLSATDNAVLDAIAASTAAIEAGQLPDSHNVTVNNASLAITAASLPLPSGAATDAKLDTIISNQLPNSHDVTIDNASLAITAAALPLPSGAATAANQATQTGYFASIDTDTSALKTGVESVIEATGDPVPASAVLIGGRDADGNVQFLAVASDGALYVDSGTEQNFALQYDNTGVGGVSYIGEAVPGSITSASVWRIKRMTETGPNVAIVWADGDASFDNIWDNRASLSYS